MTVAPNKELQTPNLSLKLLKRHLLNTQVSLGTTVSIAKGIVTQEECQFEVTSIRTFPSSTSSHVDSNLHSEMSEEGGRITLYTNISLHKPSPPPLPSTPLPPDFSHLKQHLIHSKNIKLGIFGSSGSGKTYNLKKLLSTIAIPYHYASAATLASSGSILKSIKKLVKECSRPWPSIVVIDNYDDICGSAAWNCIISSLLSPISVLVLVSKTREALEDCDAVYEITSTTETRLALLRSLGVKGRQEWLADLFHEMSPADICYIVSSAKSLEFVDVYSSLTEYRGASKISAPVLWDDLKGLDSPKASLLALTQSSSESIRGVILHGPPGTGKTLLAASLAHHLSPEWTFTAVKISEIVFGEVGESEKALQELFSEPGKRIVFLDELDGLVSSSSITSKRIISTLGLEMERSIGCLVIAATNYLDRIPRSLFSPTRFSEIISVPLPSPVDLAQIFQGMASRVVLDPEFNKLVESGGLAFKDAWSGADLRECLRRAGSIAVFNSCEAITLEHWTQALETFQ
jgi:SpoVK/Ycf46/Vps4 family AAA+-type ATPase